MWPGSTFVSRQGLLRESLCLFCSGRGCGRCIVLQVVLLAGAYSGVGSVSEISDVGFGCYIFAAVGGHMETTKSALVSLKLLVIAGGMRDGQGCRKPGVNRMD